MESIELQIHQINKNISTNFDKIDDIGVLSGLAGLALFNFRYSSYFGTNCNTGQDILEKCINKINLGYREPSFCSGIIGFAWTIDYLINKKFIPSHNNEVLFDIDNYNSIWIELSLKNKNFDFLHGAIGYTNYYINRYNIYTAPKIKEKIEHSITLVLNYISELSSEIELFSNGSKKTDVKMSFENNVIFGLAHGVSSIIFILNKISTVPKFNSKAKLLSNHYTSYLLKYKDDKNSGISLFPNFLDSKGIVKYQSALSWCTGDLGIGINLLNTSVHYNQNENYKLTSIEILEHATYRTSSERSLLKSSCLCHGYLGAYKIFAKAYKITKKEEFLKASNYWLNLGLKNILINDKSDLSILNGLSGIGLALLDIFDPQTSDWDECLFL